MTKNSEVGWNLSNSYSSLPNTFYNNINLNLVSSPTLVILNEPLAESLGLSVEVLKEESIEVFAGNKTPKDMVPLAQAYAGHQFGHFTMLGDGRAMLIGEHMTPKGEKFDIQLKGSGRTPYSRGGDGRASLGPMLREYIISEAMHGLGITTTRSLAVVTTGDMVIRQTKEIGSIMTRVASSHLRVGTFQYASNFGNIEELKSLADYTIERHFKEIKEDENPYISLLQNVIDRQAKLIVNWQLVGFIHGVMNTDNMTISGETIDYGPCAFMDTYDPKTVFSSIDTYGRYAYGNQPAMAKWNLARFAETLIPLIDNDKDKSIEIAQELISEFDRIYNENWIKKMRFKLGIFNEEKQDKELIENLLDIMEKNKADYTNTFRSLTLSKLDCMKMFKTDEFIEWNKLWESRLERQEETKELSKKLMKDNNPSVIPRNHRVEEALEFAVKNGDYSVMKKLLDVLSNPYKYSPEQEEYSSIPEESSKSYRTFCGT